MPTSTPENDSATASRTDKAVVCDASGSAPVVLTAAQWEKIVAGIRRDGQLVTKLRREVETLERYKRRIEWLHDCSTGCTDAEGFEWGIYRVKWENGQAVQVWQTNSDFSDLDREMHREASLPNDEVERMRASDHRGRTAPAPDL